MGIQTTTPPEPTMQANGLKITATLADWKAAVAALQTIRDESRIEAMDQRARFAAVCPAHVAMMEVTVPAEGAAYDLAFDHQRATEFFKKAAKGDVVLSADGERGSLSDSDGVVRSFTLFEETQAPKPPNLNLPALVTIDAAAFLRVLQHAGGVSDHVRLYARPDGVFVVRADGINNDDVLRKEFDGAVAEGLEDVVCSLYSLDYLTSIIKAAKGDVWLKLGTDYPLPFGWTVGPFEVRAFLAPRIESGEDGDPEGLLGPTEPEPEPEPVQAEPAAVQEAEPVDPEPLTKQLLISIQEAGPDGARWDDLMLPYKTEEEKAAAEEALNLLMDRGMAYEPILGTMKAT